MKIATFLHQNRIRIGAVLDGAIVDSAANDTIPSQMAEFLAAGPGALLALQAQIDSGQGRLPLQDIQLLAPVPRPGKFLAISLNYADHIAETGRERPEYPSFFTKQSTCVIGNGAAIVQPRVSTKLDYEGELAFVIGQRCRHVPLGLAHTVIAGFTIANDVSVRDWQMHSPTMMVGKSFDTCGPLGPWLVTADEIPRPAQFNAKNLGERRTASTRQHGRHVVQLF